MRFLYLSIFLLIGSLEVASQQLLEIAESNTIYLTIHNQYSCKDLKVLRGAITDAQRVGDSPSILGKVKEGKTHTTFTPLVPFDSAVPYTLVCDVRSVVFEIAKPTSHEPLHVKAIYPASQQVPANILKWYIQFSKPVNPVKIYQHIHFLDQDGRPIDRSILDLGAPLLSADGTLLTIWIEPGRQKRLLGPNKHLGSVFESGSKYTLQLDASLKDAQGLSMEETVRYHFETVASDRIKPQIAQWKVSTPRADTQEALSIICDEQLDYGSLLDAFSLTHNGQPIAGQLSYDSAKNRIHYAPESNWTKGNYIIKFGRILEDLAGNNLLHLFDRPLDESQAHGAQQELRIVIE